MDDHCWSLRSWDQDGVAVVKVYCGECRGLNGGSNRKHTKSVVTNLFSNFRKSHSAGHIRNYCQQKGLQVSEHPQAGGSRNNPIVVTAIDHRRMVEEGIGILGTVNESIDAQKSTFQLIGDPTDPVMKAYWFKVKCLACPREVFQLYSSKNNLEANLMNHVYGVMYAKTLEDLDCKSGRGTTLSTGKRGRPNRSSASSSQATQKELHTFFRHTQGEIPTNDENAMALRMCWGLRGPTCVNGGKSYGIEGLLGEYMLDSCTFAVTIQFLAKYMNFVLQMSIKFYLFWGD